MPFPVGMETRVVTFPAVFTTGGEGVKMFIRVVAARSFIWEATGETFLTAPVEGEADGIAVNVTLPVPGQGGMVDGAGNAVSGWTYTATYSLSHGLSAPEMTFELPSGGAPLVISPDVSAQVSGGIVNIPVPVVGPQGPPGVMTDATTLAKGAVKLAGDLGGTADLPTVPGLADKAATVHTHAQADITNLTTDLAGKAASSHTHAQADVTNLVTDLAGKAATAHSHAQADITNLVTDLAGKAASSHTHAQADITNLVTDLAGKAASSHTHGVADLTATGTRDATTFLRGDNTWATPAGGGGGFTGMRPKVGQYQMPATTATGSGGGVSFSTGSRSGMPHIVRAQMGVDGLIFKVSTGEVGIDVRALLYASDADGHPETLLAHGTALCDTSGAIVVATFTEVILSAGIYWCFLRSNGGSTIRIVGLGSNGGLPSFGAVDGGYRDRNPVVFADVGTFASPATTLTGLTYNIEASSNIPIVGLRRSS